MFGDASNEKARLAGHSPEARRKADATIAKLRKLPGHCRMCGTTKHKTKHHVSRLPMMQKGRKKSKAHRLSLSIAAKTRDPETRKHSVESKKKMSLIRLRIEKRLREERRRKGLPHDKHSEEWYRERRVFWRLRPLVKARDDNKCVNCGATKDQQRIVVHHIDHNQMHNWLHNLVTLCHPCNIHAEADMFYYAWQKKFYRYTKSFPYEFEEVA